MNLKKILSLITSIAFCICCVSFTGSNAEENCEDEAVELSENSTNFTVLQGDSIGNTYHRLIKETVTDESSFTDLKYFNRDGYKSIIGNRHVPINDPSVTVIA